MLIEKYGEETFNRGVALLEQYKAEGRHHQHEALIVVPLAEAIFNNDEGKAQDFYETLYYRMLY